MDILQCEGRRFCSGSSINPTNTELSGTLVPSKRCHYINPDHWADDDVASDLYYPSIYWSERAIMRLRRAPLRPTEYFARAGKGRSITKYSKNQIVFSQGDPADAVFYVQNGKVRVSVISDRGKEAIVSILGPDDFFGEGCISGQALRISSVHSITESIIVRIEKQEMVRLLHEDPPFSEMFTSHLLKRAMRTEADLIDQLFNSSERRLARLLLILANYGNEGKSEPVLAKISQETLAEMIGTTRSRVSFFMNRFRKLGFISYNGHIEVHQSLLNLVLHEKLQINDLNT